MPVAARCRRLLLSGGAIALGAISLGPLVPVAAASGPPLLGDTWSLSAQSDSVRLAAEVNPNGLASAYHFDYITQAAYEANLAQAKDGFTGAAKAPPVADLNIGAGTSYTTVAQVLGGLPASTTYRYRAVPHNSAGAATGAPHSFTTRPANAPPLADSRGFELVSPINKNGGGVAGPGEIAGGGILQAAAQGSGVTYSSTASFADPQGAPTASQYLATRTEGGWSTQDISVSVFSGSYGATDRGVPYQLFSGELSRALLLNGDHCRGETQGCAVANPPMAGTDAPEGYQDYYLRDSSTASYTALLGAPNAGFLELEPKVFDLRLAGSTTDLGHVVLSSCAKLSANATEVPLGEGCDPAAQNLYEWSGGGLQLLNLLPGKTTGTPAAQLAAPLGAISEDGFRVYFTEEGKLFLREGSQTKLVAEGASFQTASTNGAIALYTKADEHLYRYEATGAGQSTDLTPSGGVKGVVGAAAAADIVYYQDGSGLERWHSGTTTTVAAGAEAASAGDWPPATGSARVSPDGTKLLFLSAEELTGYDNTDLNTKVSDPELFLYDASAASPLACVSCNPTNGRPLGPATIPGAIANGTAPGSVDSYKPRVLTADGRRVFFDSADSLASTDTNSGLGGVGVTDAYEWEAQGEGSCIVTGGCVSLISSGHDAGGAHFVDASADGADVFFLTDASLVSADPGSTDLYDARVGGGFPEAPTPLACEGDACQPLPSAPTDPTLDTLLNGAGNPPVRIPGARCKKGSFKRKDKCVPKHRKRHSQHKGNHKSRRGR